MKILNKLTFWLLLLFIGIITLFSGNIYYSYIYYNDIGKLKYTFIFTFIICLILIIVIGRFLLKQFLNPVSRIVARVEEISASNLHLRIDEGKNDDEIEKLAFTFNQMLDRLEKSFTSQKEFVSNISHELRTPLAALTTELEIALIKERKPEEYKKVIALALNDVHRMTRLSNGLLNLAKATYDQKEIKFKEIRLDELLMDARQSVQKSNQEYKITVLYEREIESDASISIVGNEYLLKVAFINLMENGCKFSEDKQATVAISYFKEHIILRFSDTGIGIPENEMENIFNPFFRGSNKNYADGNGIGLSLTTIIVALHKGNISVASKVNEGTTFTIELPHL